MHIYYVHTRHSFVIHTTHPFTTNSVCRNVWPKYSRLPHLVSCAVVLLARPRMVEPQSEIDLYCSESYDIDEIGDHQCSDFEQEALTHEHHVDDWIRCPWCDVEVDISCLHCPRCGGGLTVFEPGVDSDVERSLSSFSLRSESSSISFSGCPSLPGVVQLLLDQNYVVQGIVPESQAEQTTGSVWL